jgi:rod shape-determining protein MreD
MTAVRVILAALVALVAQGLITRLLGIPSMRLDLGLVAVVWIALRFGRVPGLLGGTLIGLGQDALAGGVLGLGGLAKTVAGFVTGIVGTQFIVTQTVPRFMVFLGATALHAFVFVGFSMLLGLKIPERPFLDVTLQAIANAVIGILVFKLVEFTPGARERWRGYRERRHKRRFH